MSRRIRINLFLVLLLIFCMVMAFGFKDILVKILSILGTITLLFQWIYEYQIKNNKGKTNSTWEHSEILIEKDNHRNGLTIILIISIIIAFIFGIRRQIQDDEKKRHEEQMERALEYHKQRIDKQKRNYIYPFNF